MAAKSNKMALVKANWAIFLEEKLYVSRATTSKKTFLHKNYVFFLLELIALFDLLHCSEFHRIKR